SSASFVVYRLTMRKPIRIGIGGPVGSGKTALVDCLCKSMRDRYRLGVITNDIFTREDMEFLVRSEALSADRIIGVQTGGCPHTAIREDASMNFEAIDEMTGRHRDLDVIFLEDDARRSSVRLHQSQARRRPAGRHRVDPARALLRNVARGFQPSAADRSPERLALRDDRSPSAIGRKARLELRFERRGARTVI